jgi:type II secretory pathway pseudopilin PulG
MQDMAPVVSLSRRCEAGYSMVVLMVAVTILMVLTAAALPMWSQAMKRDKEAELIFRGWQYAEAIRVFQQRHGRLPTRLQELIEVKPRSIRKLWKDPMTESGEWGLVPPGAGAVLGGGGQELVDSGGPNDGRQDRGPRAPRPGEQRSVGPIVGVRSLSQEESIRVLFDEESYDQWLFTSEKLAQAVTGGGQVGVGGGRTDPRPILPRVQWLGKPFPPGVQPQQGQAPGGNRLVPGGPPGGGGGQPVGPDGRPRQQPPRSQPPRDQ